MPNGDGGAPVVSIIIPAWRLRKELRGCLDAIERDAEGPSFEVIVVVNGANPEVRAVAEAHPLLPQVIPLVENVGFGWACNVGAQAAQGQYLVFLNDDTEVLPGWRANLVAAAQQHRAAVVGSVLLSDPNTVLEAGVRMLNDGEVMFMGAGVKLDDPGNQLSDRTVDYASGAALLIDAQVFRELGGFDAAFMPAYYEDTDLQFRIKALGREVWVAADARVLHHNNLSTKGLESFREFAVSNSKAHFLSRWGNVIRRAAAPDDADNTMLAIPHRSGIVGSLEVASSDPEIIRTKAAEIQRNYTIWLESHLLEQDKELAQARERAIWLDGELADQAKQLAELDERLQHEIADRETQIAEISRDREAQIAEINRERETQIREISQNHARESESLRRQVETLGEDLGYWRDYALDSWDQRVSRSAELENEVAKLKRELVEEQAREHDLTLVNDHLNREIEEKNGHIERLNQEVETRDNQIRAFQNTVSWRVTSPLRIARQIQRRL